MGLLEWEKITIDKPHKHEYVFVEQMGRFGDHVCKVCGKPKRRIDEDRE